jgi:hypothetical protein
LPASSHPKKTKKKTSFVPRKLFLSSLAAASVIPLVACGGDVSGGQLVSVASSGFMDGGTDSVARVGFDGQVFSVATRAFDGALDSVAVMAFDAGSDADSGISFTVAACCFDAAVGDAADDSTVFSVGASAFDASLDANPDGTQ